MSEDLRRAAQDERLADVLDAARLRRVQEELSGARHTATRCCPRCGRPIRGGQPVTRIYGTAVHQHCDGARDQSRRSAS